MPNQSHQSTNSELLSLLTDNYHMVGLPKEKAQRAKDLIANPQYSPRSCYLCPQESKQQSIYDTQLCQDHARKSLEENTQIR